MNNLITDEEIKTNELSDANIVLQKEVDQLRKEYDDMADRLLDQIATSWKMRLLLAHHDIKHDF